MPTEKNSTSEPGNSNRRQIPRNWAVPFFTFWTGQAFSLIGSRLVQFALIWWLTRETESATVLTIASLVGLLPSILLYPFAGALVDRWNRQWIMLIADSVIAMATLWIAYLFHLGDVQIWAIYFLMFVRSLAEGFHQPAMVASTSLMVPEKELTRIQGFNQMLGGGLNIISAPLGAILLEVMPLSGILSIDVITALFAVGPLLFITIPQPEKDPAQGKGFRSVIEDIKGGFAYVFTWPGLLVLIGLAVVINLVATPSFSLFPLLVKTYFGGGALELGWADSAYGIGVVLGGLLLGTWGGFNRRIYTTIMGLLGFGAGFLLVGLSPANWFFLAVGGMFIIGLMLSMINGPALAILQATIDPQMQGRVFSLITSLSKISAPLGLIIAGPLAEFTSVRTWFLTAGFITVLIGVASLFIPALIGIEEHHRSREAAEVALEEA
ncbi:MAG: MFS transporter [Anaerolineales bacterium]|nr:MFS transporter [Anaerolineales bacterium]